ncbi:MAG: hypothetical protein Q8N60_00905 [Candidatus Diapherotrites archaeon]|nr:hypothetical protein [Candidatus Diapherotrites archaeon]
MADGNILTEVWAAFYAGLQEAGKKLVIDSIPVVLSLIGATILILIGWVIGKILKQIVIKLLQSTRVDQWIDEQNLSAAIGGKEVSALAGSLVKWYIIVLFLAAAAENVKLSALQQFLTALVYYIPGVLGGILVFVGGLLLGRYAKNSIDVTQHKMKNIAAALAEGIIILFTGILALTMILGKDTMSVLKDYLNLFIGPFIIAFACVTAVVLGVVCLIAFKEDIRKMAVDLKKSLK